MNLYLNYFQAEICQPNENPPIGIVIRAKKDELLMEYTLQGIEIIGNIYDNPDLLGV